MSFQSFRLGEMAMQHPLPPHLIQLQQPSTSTAVQLAGQDNTKIGQRAPYGSGDSDDGYTLVFPNLEAFHEWRRKEEESQVVEFVKGDTHGSKAVPPRFKEHTKLVCARHSRSGRKKYVKKHPERIRKVPSRKIDGQGCPASISFKTYFDSDEVRACYISQHSHEIGFANLPFTRRGRKAAAEQQRTPRRQRQTSDEDPATPTLPHAQQPPPPPANANAFSSGVSMLGPPPPHYTPGPQAPGQPYYQHSYPYQPHPPSNPEVSQDRWQNMETLFLSIREHARTFSYPVASIAALESVLIRLFLESPPQAQAVPVMQNHQHQHQHQHQHPPQPQTPPPLPPQAQNNSARDPPAGEEEEESGSDESS